MKTRLRRLMTLCLCLVLMGTSAAFPQKLLAESPSASDVMNAVFDTPYRHTLQSDYASIRRSTLSEWTEHRVAKRCIGRESHCRGWQSAPGTSRNPQQ